MFNKREVPVLMYHSIGIPDSRWDWNYLTCPYQKFEEQLKAIKLLGYKTISLKKLEEIMVDGNELDDKYVVITFDDGYLDIWTYAYPLLKKYDMCGTVFINPEFVDQGREFSPLYTDADFKEKEFQNGYLSWEEIKSMDKEGVVFSESHALTHTWYPKSGKIIDFRHPSDNYRWMTWNENTQLKSKLWLDDEDLVDFGVPVYENEKSLMVKRYFADPKLGIHLSEFVKSKGNKRFFANPEWKEILFNEVDKFKKENKLVEHRESDEEFYIRVKHELTYTKSILEKHLDRRVNFLCWPGGSATKDGMRIAKESGYTFFNSARDMTLVERKYISNSVKGGDRVKRFAPILYFNGEENNKSKIIYSGKLYTALMLLRQSNAPLSRYWFKALDLITKNIFGRILNAR